MIKKPNSPAKAGPRLLYSRIKIVRRGNFSSCGRSLEGRQLLTSKKDSGQVMLLTILILSAVFLMTTVIAGLLMVYQLDQVTKVADSARAIFAADAATERALFVVFRCNHPDPAQAPVVPNPSWISSVNAICLSAASQSPDLPPPPAVPKFLNGASYQMTIFTDNNCNGSHQPGAHFGNVTCIKATGRAGHSSRAFRVDF